MPPSTLLDAAGWLIVRRGEDPFLAEDEPLFDGTRRSDAGAPVALAPDAWGVEQDRDSVSEGPFLVHWLGLRDRSLVPGNPTWVVVARYDPSRSVRVVIP